MKLCPPTQIVPLRNIPHSALIAIKTMSWQNRKLKEQSVGF